MKEMKGRSKKRCEKWSDRENERGGEHKDGNGREQEKVKPKRWESRKKRKKERNRRDRQDKRKQKREINKFNILH